MFNFSFLPDFKLRQLLLLITLLLLGLPVLMVLLLKFIDPSVWMWQLQREMAPPANYPDQAQHRWVSLDKISPNMQLAVIAAEDQKFPEHWGLDIESIQAAIASNSSGKRVRGASTLSQQTAKNLFLWPDKSYFRKGLEAGFTLLMEGLWDKERILEVYLNIAEFGPGVYGVEAASQSFFAKRANQLSRSESARLAAVLPNPYRMSAEKPSRYVWQRSQWIQNQMRLLGSRYWVPDFNS